MIALPGSPERRAGAVSPLRVRPSPPSQRGRGRPSRPSPPAALAPPAGSAPPCTRMSRHKSTPRATDGAAAVAHQQRKFPVRDWDIRAGWLAPIPTTTAGPSRVTARTKSRVWRRKGNGTALGRLLHKELLPRAECECSTFTKGGKESL